MYNFQTVLSGLVTTGTHYLGVAGMIGLAGVVLGKLCASRTLLFGGGLILGIEFYQPILKMAAYLEHGSVSAQSIDLSGISRIAMILLNQLRG